MKKNKLNNNGFILAETLVVTVFLMILFSMLYSNFYPLIGEYEKRENYDTVDGKYSVFWLKRMIEDKSYALLADSNSILNFDSRAYVRFQCSDVSEEDDKRATCINLVKSMQIEGCDKNGNNCEIYITKYRIGESEKNTANFKNTVKNNLQKYEENCFSNKCHQKYVSNCINEKGLTDGECTEEAEKKVFRSSFQDYVKSLPDYTIDSLNGAEYRVIAEFHNRKDNNNYFSYATIEVNRGFVPTTTSSNMNSVSIKYSANGATLKTEHGPDYSMSGNMILKDGTSVMHALLPGRSLPDSGLLDYNDPSNINIERLGYYIEEGQEWNNKVDGTGTSYNQNNSYIAEDFCPNISSGNCTVTLYANWKPTEYTITYDYNGGPSADNPATYTIESDNIQLNNPPGDGFLGWTGSNGTAFEKKVTIPKGSTGDRTYKANWTEKGPYSNNESPPKVYQTLTEALSGTNEGYTIFLNYDFTDTSSPVATKTVKIDLNGHTLYTNNKITVTGGATTIVNGTIENSTSIRTLEVSGGTLNIGISGDNTTVTKIINAVALDSTNYDSCAVKVVKGSNLNINGEKTLIKSGVGSNSKYANALDSQGTVVMNDARIEVNVTSGGGGGAINTSGSFTMNSGYIYVSKLGNGRCAVCVTGGTTRVLGGTVEVKGRMNNGGLDGGAVDKVSGGCAYVSNKAKLICTGTDRCLYGNTQYLFKDNNMQITANNVQKPDVGTKVGKCS